MLQYARFRPPAGVVNGSSPAAQFVQLTCQPVAVLSADYCLAYERGQVGAALCQFHPFDVTCPLPEQSYIRKPEGGILPGSCSRWRAGVPGDSLRVFIVAGLTVFVAWFPCFEKPT